MLRFRRRAGQKGRLADQHLVQDDADAPPVAQLRVAAALQHFRRNVVGRPDQRVGQTALVVLQAAALQHGGLAALGRVVPRLHRVLAAVVAYKQQERTDNAQCSSRGSLILLTLTGLLVVFGVVRPAEAGAQTEIGQLDVAVAIDENVVGFDVPVNIKSTRK